MIVNIVILRFRSSVFSLLLIYSLSSELCKLKGTFYRNDYTSFSLFNSTHLSTCLALSICLNIFLKQDLFQKAYNLN